MKKIVLFILLMAGLMLPAGAQNSKSRSTLSHRQTTVQKSRRSASSKTTSRSSKKTSATKASRKGVARNNNNITNASIQKLRNQRADIQRKIRQQEQALKQNKADVSKRLNDLMAINGEIDKNQQNIDGIQKDIRHINGNIGILNSQLNSLKMQLKQRQNNYIKSMRYMARHRSVQDRLMFIFSAKNFYQMYRRLRFVREYA